jgi:hypothetical protein
MPQLRGNEPTLGLNIEVLNTSSAPTETQGNFNKTEPETPQNSQKIQETFLINVRGFQPP